MSPSLRSLVPLLASLAAACSPPPVAGDAAPDVARPDVALDLSEPLPWDSVAAGEAATQILVLRNLGGDPAVDLQAGLAGDAAAFVFDGLPSALAPGESTPFEVAFAPTAGGPHEATLTVQADDADAATVLLQGTGAAPIVSAPATVELQAIPEGCSTMQDVPVRNTGAVEVALSDLELSTPSSTLRLGVDPATWSATLGPGAEVGIPIEWGPTPVEPVAGVLRVRTTDPLTPQLEVAVQGQSVGSARVVEEFVVPDEALDVLFVVDSSACSTPEQSILAQALAEALLVPDLVDVDWRLAVTTADPNDDGRFVSGVIRSDEGDDPVADASAAVEVGADGAGVERGLDGAYRALSEPNLSTTNAGLLRDSVPLAIVLMSDEADQSSLLAGPADYADALTGAKRDPGQVRAHDITGGPTGCNGDASSGQAGAAYRAVTELTGGVPGSVCDLDLAPTVTDQLTASLIPPRLVPVPDTYVPGTLQVQGPGPTPPLDYADSPDGPMLDEAPSWGVTLEVSYVDGALCPAD